MQWLEAWRQGLFAGCSVFKAASDSCWYTMASHLDSSQLAEEAYDTNPADISCPKLHDLFTQVFL